MSHIYLVKTEPNAEENESDVPTFDAYESEEDAREHNNRGHWSHHALYKVELHEE